jgi:hypothetical protein
MSSLFGPNFLRRDGTIPASIGVLLLAIGIASAMSFTTLDQEYEKRLDKVLTTTGQFEICAAYVDLFEKCGREELRKLTAHHHDGVALQAAWEQI